MRVRATVLFVVLAAAAAILGVPISGSTAAVCAPTLTPKGAPWPGGEWRTYGHDSSNTRTQPEESSIGPLNVATLAPAWVFSASESANNGGGFANTPVVADGCVYLATNTGWVFSLNADTGELVWRTKLEGESLALVAGAITGSPVVVNGMVFVGVSNPGDPGEPYVAALDQATGQVLWRTIVEVGQTNSFITAGPVYHDGMILQGFGGYEGNTEVSRGGYVILDAGRNCDNGPQTVCTTPVAGATGGRVMVHRYTVSDEEFARGFRGASIWCTAVVDPETRHAYSCGGNPHSEGKEALYANSLLKIDLDRARPTFGSIVASYKGNVDQYYPGLDDNPICERFAEETVILVWSAGCVMLDLDFGASPNLFRDASGRLLVGDLQKSGVYHAVNTEDMSPAWSAVVGLPCFSCNAASPAVDSSKVYAVGTPPGQLVALDRNGGLLPYRWLSPILDGIHYQSVSVANDVVYVMDNLGTMHVFDATTGLPLLKRNLALDTGGAATDPGSQGISIARNTVYAASGEYVVAYRPGTSGGNAPGLPELPSPPGLGGTTVVAIPGSVTTTYGTPFAFVQADNPRLDFLNLDLAQHDVDHLPNSGPQLFQSELAGLGETVRVNFTGPLQAGQRYGFYCSLHPNMTGEIFAI